MPGQYDDWELEVRAYENGYCEVRISIPHDRPEPIVIGVEPGQIQAVSNILDAGLGALQTKPKEITDGSARPTDN